MTYAALKQDVEQAMWLTTHIAGECKSIQEFNSRLESEVYQGNKILPYCTNLSKHIRTTRNLLIKQFNNLPNEKTR